MQQRHLYQALIQPWKLATLAFGLGALIAGAYYHQISDWDVGVSLLMGILTYLTAPFAVRTILHRDWRNLPLALFFAYFTVDGCYWVYHTIAGNVMLREANAFASTPLYFFMGCIWLWNGSLKSLFSSTIAAARRQHQASPAATE